MKNVINFGSDLDLVFSNTEPVEMMTYVYF